MKIGEYCKRCVVSITSKSDAADASKLMRAGHVGFLIVYREGDELKKPVGVLTDRDLVLGVLARDIDPHSVTVDDVMTRQPLIATEVGRAERHVAGHAARRHSPGAGRGCARRIDRYHGAR